MLKRFYSKKSGFTLVEIIIAFAVFAIMASMIVQILQLSVAARHSNNVYQSELAAQEKLLTVIQKNSEDFVSEKGKIKFSLGGGTYELPYDIISAKDGAEFATDGLGYLLSPVSYNNPGEGSPSDDAGSIPGANTGSQASRMDTRLTGTTGIGYIWVQEVIKDTFDYSSRLEYAPPAGCTRYYFRVSASSKDMENNETLESENIAYSQYKLFFYDDVNLNGAGGSITFTDKDGKKYTKDVPATARIAQVGYVNANVGASSFKGLNDSNSTQSMTDAFNKYTVQQSGDNGVRIGSPYKIDWSNGGQKGVKFDASSFSNFYVDFYGDVTLTSASFGKNGTHVVSGSNDLGYRYGRCPSYVEDYDSNGNPEYNSTEIPCTNIYGAYLYKRNYVGAAPDDGGDA